MTGVGYALGVLGFLGGSFYLWVALNFDAPRWQEGRRQGEAEASKRRTDGYKVNIAGFFAWFWRTRSRMVFVVCWMFAFGALFTLMAMSGSLA